MSSNDCAGGEEIGCMYVASSRVSSIESAVFYRCGAPRSPAHGIEKKVKGLNLPMTEQLDLGGNSSTASILQLVAPCLKGRLHIFIGLYRNEFVIVEVL